MNCPTDTASWMAAAAAELVGLRNADGGWPYQPGGASATEPTALGLLALSGTDALDLSAPLDWLLARRRSDGFFTASIAHAEPSWLTPLAAMACRRLGREDAAEAAATALLSEPVATFSSILAGDIYGYDTGIPGWPWAEGDFSFVEPTALAMAFLKQAGRSGEGRVRQGAQLLHARAMSGGGWNYGEPQVLGGELFATVAPTALALIALADEQDATTGAALAWLRGRQGAITSLFSLGWAAAAMNVLGLLDDAWSGEVIARWCAAPAGRRGPRETALCMLGLRSGPDHPLGIA